VSLNSVKVDEPVILIVRYQRGSKYAHLSISKVSIAIRLIIVIVDLLHSSGTTLPK
jgi:hypothetical protein